MKILISFLVAILITCSLSAQIAVPPAIGNGTIENPYQVETLDNLYWITQNSGQWNKHYIQIADIDANATSGWNSGAGFSPIGYNIIKFTGSYNGQNHIIDGLYIYSPSGDDIGFFGYTYGASIENTGVINIDFFGDYRVGGLVGRHRQNSSISNCYATGSLTGGDFVGGLVGTQDGSSITCTSFASVSVTGQDDRVGGLIGNSESASIINCYAVGSVTGTYGYGGNRIGGLIGWNNVFSTINNCYSICTVSTGGDWVGGLIGRNDGTVSNSFWNTTTSWQSSSAGGTGKTTTQLKNIRTFTNVAWSIDLSSPWDFVSNPYDDAGSNDFWNMDGIRINDGYPFLSWQGSIEPPDAPANISTTIVGTIIEIEWSAVTSATSYSIYSSNDPNLSQEQ